MIIHKLKKMEKEYIENEEEYDLCIKRLDEIISAVEGTKEYDELEQLSDKIEKYETIHYPIGEPTEEEMVQFMKEQKGV